MRSALPFYSVSLPTQRSLYKSLYFGIGQVACLESSTQTAGLLVACLPVLGLALLRAVRHLLTAAAALQLGGRFLTAAAPVPVMHATLTNCNPKILTAVDHQVNT